MAGRALAEVLPLFSNEAAVPAQLVRLDTPQQREWARQFVHQHHSYIRWTDRPSRKLGWLLYEGGQLVGVFALASAWVMPKAVSSWMEARGLAYNEVANNTVYCLDGAGKNAGTRFLRLLRADAASWWRSRYGDELRAMQTFILPPRTGALYKADNWEYLGPTAGMSLRSTASRRLALERSTEAVLLAVDEDGAHSHVEGGAMGEGKAMRRLRRATVPKLIFVRRLGGPPERPVVAPAAGARDARDERRVLAGRAAPRHVVADGLPAQDVTAQGVHGGVAGAPVGERPAAGAEDADLSAGAVGVDEVEAHSVTMASHAFLSP